MRKRGRLMSGRDPRMTKAKEWKKIGQISPARVTYCLLRTLQYVKRKCFSMVRRTHYVST